MHVTNTVAGALPHAETEHIYHCPLLGLAKPWFYLHTDTICHLAIEGPGHFEPINTSQQVSGYPLAALLLIKTPNALLVFCDWNHFIQKLICPAICSFLTHWKKSVKEAPGDRCCCIGCSCRQSILLLLLSKAALLWPLNIILC